MAYGNQVKIMYLLTLKFLAWVKQQTFSEKCLSIPNLHMNVTTPAKITIQVIDLEGYLFEKIFTGLQATNFMHEYI